MFHIPNCLLAIALLLPTTAWAQVTLELKYPEETQSTSEVESKTTQTLTLAGMNVDTKSSSFMTVKRVIGKRGSDGTLEVTDKVDALQAETLLAGMSARFDSIDPDKKADNPLLEPIIDLLRAAYRVPVTMELDAKNKVQKFNVPEGEFEKLGDLAKDQFSPESLKQGSLKAQRFLPDEPVKAGDTWERVVEINAGQGQLLSFRTKYEYVGTVEQTGTVLDKITEQVTEASFSINGNQTLQVKNCELKVVESTGTYLFNRELGATISRESKLRVAGPLTLVYNGQELPGKVDLNMEESAKRQK